MGPSINRALSNASAAYAAANSNSAAAAAQQAEQAQQQANQQAASQAPAPYVVKLTEAQQVYQLNNQGQTVPQIANALSLSVEEVNNYLGINGSST